jgi:hypothetical protein
MLSRDVVKDIDNLKIETWVNDVLVQVGNTRDMEFSCGQVLFFGRSALFGRHLPAVPCLQSCALAYRVGNCIRQRNVACDLVCRLALKPCI